MCAHHTRCRTSISVNDILTSWCCTYTFVRKEWGGGPLFSSIRFTDNGFHLLCVFYCVWLFFILFYDDDDMLSFYPRTPIFLFYSMFHFLLWWSVCELLAVISSELLNFLYYCFSVMVHKSLFKLERLSRAKNKKSRVFHSNRIWILIGFYFYKSGGAVNFKWSVKAEWENTIIEIKCSA